MKCPTIAEAVQLYSESLQISTSDSTSDTYSFAKRAFTVMLVDKDIDPETTPVSMLEEDAVIWFSTERLHSPNLPRLRLLVRQRGRRAGQRLPQFPRDDIERVIEHVQIISPSNDQNEQLRNWRDAAFILTLADTGLRVHEACKLHRGDIDWNEGRAVIIGKGDKQAVIRFSSRSLAALKAYLSVRAPLDGAPGKPLASLPLFARHDKGAGKKVKPITTATGRNIVDEHVKQALGDSA